jgi:eukaryotic-like serine/threonine-protein kinase
MNEESLFAAALEQGTPAERAAFLDEACSGDVAMRQRMEALLQSHEHDEFLGTPAVKQLAEQPNVPRLPAELLQATFDEPTATKCPGTMIGPYKLLQPIGEGGMGTVYMAEQTQPVRRIVAIKLIKPGMDSRQVLARFGAERQALALMDHPNIARVFDAGTTDARLPYFVMELVKGIPITRFCDERRLTLRERLELAIPVCQAVQHAHQKGVIHRDLKPSNVLIALYDGKPVPKVIDFGVAKATGPRLTDQTLYTEFGAVVGTLEYMSPEQAELNQLDIDTRSDIYSLGVLLYELLTGSTPLEHRRINQSMFLEVLRLIREEESPRPSLRLSTTDELPSIAARRDVEPRKLSGLVRGELDWIVMKALEKDRARRYETASGLAADLRRYLDDEPVQACPPSALYRFGKFARRNKPTLIASGLIVAAMAATVGMLAVSNVLITREKNQKEEALVNARISEKNAMEHELIAHREFSSAQRSLAQQALETGRTAFDRGQVGQGLLWTLQSWRSAIAARDLTWQHVARANLSAWLPYHHRLKAVFSHSSPVEDAAFSPDGKTVVTGGDDGTAQLWDIATGTAIGHPFQHPRDVNTVAFSPDGKTILTGCYDGTARLWETATGRLAGSPISHEGEGEVVVVFNPDGKSFVTGFQGATIQVWDSATHRPIRKVVRNRGLPVAFTPDGQSLIIRSGPAQIWDLANGKPKGPVLLVSEESMSVALSPDGKTIAIGHQSGELRLWDAVTGLAVGALMRHEERVRDVVFSPDGEVMLSGSNDNTARLWDVASGKQIGFPIQHQGPVVAVAFSPDGKNFLTTSSDGTVRVWDSSLHQPVALLIRQDWSIETVAFTPNGKSLVTGGRGGAQLWDATDGRPIGAPIRHQLVWGGCHTMALSPDGKKIATAGIDKAARVWSLPSGLPIGAPLLHPEPVESVAFSPDCRTLITGCHDRTVRLWDEASGTIKGRPMPQADYVETMAVSPVGDVLLVAYQSGAAQLWDLATCSPQGKSYPHP